MERMMPENILNCFWVFCQIFTRNLLIDSAYYTAAACFTEGGRYRMDRGSIEDDRRMKQYPPRKRLDGSCCGTTVEPLWSYCGATVELHPRLQM
jgi:hypothetical protein